MSAVDVEQLQPISRTYQYRKVMKPLLERKRRARINRCLDDLKEFILSTLQAEGENVSKLEKADILEFTVQHLHKLRRHNRLNGSNGVLDADRFRAGFTHCASEVSRCLASTPGVDVNLGTKLMTHLGHRLNEMEKTTNPLNPLSVRIVDNYSPAPSSPSSISSSSESALSSYNMPLTPNSSVGSCATGTSLSGRSRTVSPPPGLLSVSVDMSPSSLPASPLNLGITSSSGGFKFGSTSSLPMWRPW